jgi:hypothetical protein
MWLVVERRIALAAALALGLIAIAAAHKTQAGPLTFTPVAESTGGYSAFSPPAVNDQGTVAFNAVAAGTAKIFTGSGGPVTTAFDPAAFPGAQGPVGAPAINHSGQLAFGSNQIAYFLDGSSLSTVFQAPGVVLLFNGFAAANNGAVYFAWVGFSMRQQFDRWTSSSSNNIVTAFTGVSDGLIRPGVSDDDSQNVITFHKSTPGLDQIFQNGAAVATTSTSFFDPTFGLTGTISNFGPSDVNAAGNVVFSAQFFGIADAVYLRTPAGTFTDLLHGRAIPAINDNGIIAALFTSGTKSLKYGFGNLANPIIAVGDALDGSTVTDLGFDHNGLSDSNQVAFYATLADGRSGIFVTTVPEPRGDAAALALVAMGIGRLMRRPRQAS